MGHLMGTVRWILMFMCIRQTFAQPNQATVNAIYAAIKGNVASINIGGAWPSILSIRESYVPILLDKEMRPLVAAGKFGAGAVVVSSHEAMLDFSQSDLPLNALSWLASSTKAPSIARVGTVASSNWQGLPNIQILPHVQKVTRFQLVSDVKPSLLAKGPKAAKIHIIALYAYTALTPADAKALVQFVTKGGALILGGQTWSSGNPNAALDHPANILLNQLGITILPYGSTMPETIVLPASLPSSAVYCNAYAAAVGLKGLGSLSDESRSVAVRALQFSLAEVPTGVLGAKLVAQMDALAAANPLTLSPAKALDHAAVPTPLEVLTVAYEVGKNKWLPAARIKASPAAAAFPGLGQKLAPTTQKISVKINGNYDEAYGIYRLDAAWHSTGVYVPPGQVLNISVPASAGGKLFARIGCHSDTVWEAEDVYGLVTGPAYWGRVPDISKLIPLRKKLTQVASSFGGLLYIQVFPGPPLGPLTVTISGKFVLAPTYRHGTTTPAQWNAIRAKPPTAPWTEFISDKLILTVPSSAVKSVADPAALMTWWDSVQDAHATLAQVPTVRPRPERVVLDVNISLGWMHSGYPIMGYVDITDLVVNLQKLKTVGEWGTFHELGHNLQIPAMDLPNHSGECTVNIWTVHAMTTVVGLTKEQGYGHEALYPIARKQAIDDYLAKGKPWGTDWNTFLCLETYLQLYEAFGWPLYYAVFKEYQALPEGEWPADDAAKMEWWAVRSSKQVGVNLGPFYQAWGWPLSEGAVAAVNALGLPEWAGNPMKGR